MMVKVLAGTAGSWNDVWSSFDHRQRAKAGEGVVAAPVNDEGEDMFERAGVAAE